MLENGQHESSIKVLPKYKKARSYILEKVETGKWAQGKALPSETELARELGVARNTVRQALEELAAENIVCRIHGKGTFLNTSQPQQSNGVANAFGMIVPELHRSMYPCLLKGFDEGASRTYHKTIISHTGFDLGRQADLILQMLSSDISGAALVPSISSETPAHHITALQQHNIPVVLCVRSVRDTRAPLVTWDFEQVGMLAGREFIKRGHRSIAYFACYRYEGSQAHERGLHKVLAEQGLELRDEFINYGTQLGEPQEKDKLEVLKRMLACENRPTAVLCNDDNEAEIVYLISQQIGVKVPEELAILGMGVNRREGYMKKCLSSVTVDAVDMGKKTALLLEEMSSGKRPIVQAQRILMPLAIWHGQTLGDDAP